MDGSRVLYDKISIHVLREEDDGGIAKYEGAKNEFQSTSSARRTTAYFALSTLIRPNFNPRPPRGGRLSPRPLWARHQVFQSTSSARRTTVAAAFVGGMLRYFNPRPPRGGRHLHLPAIHHRQHFNPRPPRGGRQQKYTKTCASFAQKVQSFPRRAA